MSKRELKGYLKGLKKSQLEEQIIDLYERFKEVKTFYDFAFNPQEQKIVDAAKAKVYKEYFPNTKRRAKARRSVAQKHIQHFKTIEMDALLIAEFMIYNIDIAQLFCGEKKVNSSAFYKSILKSYRELVVFIIQKGIHLKFKVAVESIMKEAKAQEWENWFDFEDAFLLLDEDSEQFRQIKS
tara:strand:+ start:4909 stop:5454 length:546 start_codon:yes stop_codon:yes gene_type:complete